MNSEAIDPMITAHPHIVEHLRNGWMQDHENLVADAKKAQRQAVRNEFCDAFNVGYDESTDNDSGALKILFPPNWTEEQAELFATDCLDIDLGNQYRGAGRYFQYASTWRREDTGEVAISVRWGTDI